MVQYSFSRSTLEELPYKPINFEKASYSFKTFFLKKIKKGCVNSASYKIIKNNSMHYEPKTKISI